MGQAFANDHRQYPTAVGSPKISTYDFAAFRFLTCYFTPSLPATIISPHAMGM
jgi:hypothetical protein